MNHAILGTLDRLHGQLTLLEGSFSCKSSLGTRKRNRNRQYAEVRYTEAFRDLENHVNNLELRGGLRQNTDAMMAAMRRVVTAYPQLDDFWFQRVEEMIDRNVHYIDRDRLLGLIQSETEFAPNTRQRLHAIVMEATIGWGGNGDSALVV